MHLDGLEDALYSQGALSEGLGSEEFQNMAKSIERELGFEQSPQYWGASVFSTNLGFKGERGLWETNDGHIGWLCLAKRQP